MGRLVRRTLLVVGIAVLATGSTVRADARGPGFSIVNLLRPEGGTEPAIAIGANAAMGITALNPTFPIDFAFTNFWQGTFASTPSYQGPVDARIQGSYGGADADVDIGSTGTLHLTTLVQVLNPNLTGAREYGISAITCPGGDTSNHYANCTSQLVDTTKTDRPFITSDGRVVYLVYHDAGNSAGIRVQRSDDDGVNWKRIGDVTSGLGKVTAGATFNNDIGPIVVDPRAHVVYSLFSSGEPGLNKSHEVSHDKIYVASSTDSGQHWTEHLVYQAPTGTNFGNPFATGFGIDPSNGSLYVAVSDGSLVYYMRSTDGASSWSSPVTLNVAPAGTALFPEVAAYRGTVDIAYYGTTATTRNDPAAAWNLYLAKSTDGGVHFSQTAVTPSPIHVGRVCTDGDACFRGDRMLADLFEIAINPANGLAAIAYAATTVGDPFRITNGRHAGTYPSREGHFTKSLLMLPGAAMKGGTTYIGRACPGDPVPPAVDDGDPTTQQIAVAIRADCLFEDKAKAALAAGYTGLLMINSAAGDHAGDEVFPMDGSDYTDIPAEMIGHSTGLAIFGAPNDAALTVGAMGASVSVGRLRTQVALARELP